MKHIKILSIISILIVAVSCRKTVQPSDLAVQAMERARVFEADVYAPLEYQTAEELFNQMNEALANNDQNLANEIAPSVVDAANLAIDVARSGKATVLIARLKQSLDTARLMGLDEEYPSEYTQATQSLIDAEHYYQMPDYENAAVIAQSGLDLLDPLIGGAESLALANINRARELLDRAYKTTDLNQTQDMLDEIAQLIEHSASEYQDGKYINSVNYSQEAIDRLNNIIEQYPNDASISIKVDQEENLQLQAYDLLRQLSEVLNYIKQNHSDQHIDEATVIPYYHPVDEDDDDYFTIEEEAVEEKGDDNSEVEILLYEEDQQAESTNTMLSREIQESVEAPKHQVELLLYEEDLDKLSYLPVNFKAQDATQITNTVEPVDSHTEDPVNFVTIEMIEAAYDDAQRYYNEANYLNSIDRSREGLRLAELYLANQTIKIHTVIKGDTLWDISQSTYNTPWLWPNIWRANKLIIKDPDLIYPKQEFRIPPAGK